MAEARIGTSGWQYDCWAGRFYPAGVAKSGWFGHYAREFDTVEVNSTFYHLPRAETFDAWREQAPGGFRYALKFSRYGTHLKYLRAPAETIGLFLERAERLGASLGPVLVQLPPRWKRDLGRLAGFLEAAPKRVRWAVECRHASWLGEETYAVLREHGAALCVHDMIERHPVVVTAGWVYVRFHGEDYGGRYSHQAMSAWARRVRGWLGTGLDVWVFFNNTAGMGAVENARQLRRYVGL